MLVQVGRPAPFRSSTLGLQHLLAAEQEQLPGQAGGAFGGEHDLLERFARSAARMSLRIKKRPAWPWMTVRRLLKSCATPAAKLADGLHFLGLPEDLLRPGALGHLGLEPFVGHLKFLGALGHESVEVFQRKRASRASSHLRVSAWVIWSTSTVSKGFFSTTRLSESPSRSPHGVPRIIRVGRADDDLQIGIDLPELLDGFDAVPSRRHAHIDKSQWNKAGRLRGRAFTISSPPVPGRRNRDRSCCGLRGARQSPKSEDARASTRAFRPARLVEDLPEILMNRGIVVDGQEAMIGGVLMRLAGCSAVMAAPGFSRNRVKRKVEPWPAWLTTPILPAHQLDEAAADGQAKAGASVATGHGAGAESEGERRDSAVRPGAIPLPVSAISTTAWRAWASRRSVAGGRGRRRLR